MKNLLDLIDYWEEKLSSYHLLIEQLDDVDVIAELKIKLMSLKTSINELKNTINEEQI